MITAQPDHKLRALRAGAKDFISKPFDVAEVLTRVRNMLEVRLLHVAIRRKNEELQKLFDQVVAERKVSERLALHVPPDSIAARLQVRPDVTPDSFTDVSVVIADIVGFAELKPAVTPARLALLLEEIFSGFDGHAKQRGLRKIKTLGNSYMAAAGVPVPAADHACRLRICRSIWSARWIGSTSAVARCCRYASESPAAGWWPALSASACTSTMCGVTPSTPPAGWNPTASRAGCR